MSISGTPRSLTPTRAQWTPGVSLVSSPALFPLHILSPALRPMHCPKSALPSPITHCLDNGKSLGLTSLLPHSSSQTQSMVLEYNLDCYSPLMAADRN